MSDSTLGQALAPLVIGKEYPPPGEDAVIAKLRDLHLKIQHVQPGPNHRGEHPKSHAGVWAHFTVSPEIPGEFRVGIFQEPRRYTAFVRFSNGRSADDRTADVRGIAVKVLIPQEGESGTPLQQDFLMANHPVFFAQNVQHAFEFLAATASGTPSSQLAMTTHPKLIGFTSKPASDLLSTTYWSQTPYKLGDSAVKYVLLPSQESAIALGDSPDCLREAIAEQLTYRKTGARFDFCINPQTDANTMPVEDPTVEWTSEPVKLASLFIYPQKFDSPEQVSFVENLQWTPWNSLPPHSPLGGINRARHGVYKDSEDLRHQTNQVPAFVLTGRESF